MPYHGMSRYQMQGDPFLHKKIGGFFKKAVNIGLGVASGIPVVGGAAGMVRGALFGPRQGQAFPGGIPLGPIQASRFQEQGVRVSGLPSLDGGRCGTRGTRSNRSGYFVQAQPGNPEAGGVWVPKDSRCVSYRRTNAGNARAARRAVRRLKSFDRLARDVKKQLKRIAK